MHFWCDRTEFSSFLPYAPACASKSLEAYHVTQKGEGTLHIGSISNSAAKIPEAQMESSQCFSSSLHGCGQDAAQICSWNLAF